MVNNDRCGQCVTGGVMSVWTQSLTGGISVNNHITVGFNFY